MLLADLVATSQAVAESPSRLRKVALLADLLRQTPADEIELVIAFLSGAPLQGRLGVAFAAVRQIQHGAGMETPRLTIREVDTAFEAIASISGSGSTARRGEALTQLFGAATADEQDFLVRLILGELRQGALEGVVVDAVASASALPAADVRRAVMAAGSLPAVGRAALVDGARGLAAVMIRVFQPVQPMLAASAVDTGDALRHLGEAQLEYKLDGARIQVHKDGDEVRVFSRTLRDVTLAVPEVVELARAWPARTVIADGEVIALRGNGLPHPFQITMRRFGRRLDIERLRAELPLSARLFDCLFLDGGALIDEPLTRRVDALSQVAADVLIPRIVTADSDVASRFARQALDAGHEGVMAKALSSPYVAGRRGQSWLKVKPARTLDLVVLAAEWGSGRRKGRLSNLHLGARDDERGGFVMLGKTFKGLTDEMLAWQTDQLLALEIGRDAYTVHVRPSLVVEIAFNDVQESPQYPGRLALRFARVKRFRDDKTAEAADSFRSVQEIYQSMTGLAPPARL